MTRKIIIITAGGYQVAVISKARSLGYQVVATDRHQTAEGLKVADFPEVVDTLDREGVLAAARKHRVSGVITEQTDVGVPTAAYVAEQLGLPGIGLETALAATNKWLMRERCRQAGIPSPKYTRAFNLAEAKAAANKIGYPVVVKPVDSQASRGVGRVSNADELLDWFEKALTYSRDGGVLIEELLLGTECTVEAFVDNDEIHVLGISDKKAGSPPYTVARRLIYPGAFSQDVANSIRQANECVTRAIGITMGLTHAEFMVTAAGPRLIEIAARGIGARIATVLLPALTGIDILGARIQQAMGQSVKSFLNRDSRHGHGIFQFFDLGVGRVHEIEGLHEAAALPGVLHLEFNRRVGDFLGRVETDEERPGFFLAQGESREEIKMLAERVASVLRVELRAE